MMTRSVLAGVMVSIGLTVANAQDVAQPSVINPLPAEATLPDGVFELSGLTLASTKEEAAAALAVLAGGTAAWEEKNVPDTVYLSSGGKFSFKHPSFLNQVVKGSDRSIDSYSVSLTTNVNETRVYRIDRRLNHGPAQQQISVPDLIGAVMAKYGEPSWHDELGRTLYWIWFEGKKIAAGGFDPANKTFGTPGGCLYAGTYVPQVFNFGQPNGQLTEFDKLDGCQTVIEVKYALGDRADLATNASFLLLDVERLRRNVADTNAWALGELQKIVDGKSGTAPKL